MNTQKRMRILAVLLVGFQIAAGIAFAQDHILAEAARTEETNGTATASAPAADKEFHSRFPRYKIEAGDSFDVSFELNPEFNQTVSVQPDGFISLRAVGDVQVAGQNVPEVTATIKNAYGKILNQPIVSVILKDFQKPYFIADGQVGHGNLKEDPELHAGDMLYVPKNTFSKYRAFLPGSSMGAFVPLQMP